MLIAKLLKTRTHIVLDVTIDGSEYILVNIYNANAVVSEQLKISNYNEIKPGQGLSKFNNSLINDEDFTEKLKKFIENMNEDSDSENSFHETEQVKWEYINFEIQKFTISYSKIRKK